jgi:hypothetical protein
VPGSPGGRAEPRSPPCADESRASTSCSWSRSPPRADESRASTSRSRSPSGGRASPGPSARNDEEATWSPSPRYDEPGESPAETPSGAYREASSPMRSPHADNSMQQDSPGQHVSLSSSSSDSATLSSASPNPPPPLEPHTRLQKGIRQPKIY